MIYSCLILAVWTVSGCDVPDANIPAQQNEPSSDLKVTDLQDPFRDKQNPDELMNFRVLTYTISPEAVDSLADLFTLLSRKDIRCTNQAVFSANGFSVGVGTFQRGSETARTLSRIGAVRTAQAGLKIPVREKEIISRIFLSSPESLYISDTSGTAETVTLGPGNIGWILSAMPDPRLRGTAQISISPAFWQQGFEDIRLLMGKEPTEFRLLDAGRFLARVEEGGFIILGPARPFADQNTLDKRLFFLPGRRPKIQFFVIICDSVGR